MVKNPATASGEVKRRAKVWTTMGAIKDYKARNAAREARRAENQKPQERRVWWFDQPVPIDRFTGWLVAWTALLFVATIGNVIILKHTDDKIGKQAEISDGQLTVMQGQLDEMKQSFAADRAYVFSSRFDGYGKSPIQPGAFVAFWFNNFGRTPAILTIPPGAKCVYSPDDFRALSFRADNPNLVTASGRMPEGFIIPIDKPFGPIQAQMEATAEQIGKAQVGAGRIYCLAMIGYSDMRDVLHETHICYFYDFGVSDFHLCPEEGANYHS